MSERLRDIIAEMVHGGVNARRRLGRGLIIEYRAPDPDTPREQWRYALTAARQGVWPEDQELKIVHDCLYSAWHKHPTALIFDEVGWTKRERRGQSGTTFGTYTITWRQWPVREMFSAPVELQSVLRSALERR